MNNTLKFLQLSHNGGLPLIALAQYPTHRPRKIYSVVLNAPWKRDLQDFFYVLVFWRTRL